MKIRSILIILMIGLTVVENTYSNENDSLKETSEALTGKLSKNGDPNLNSHQEGEGRLAAVYVEDGRPYDAKDPIAPIPEACCNVIDVKLNDDTTAKPVSSDQPSSEKKGGK